jgi:hypothetical protein
MNSDDENKDENIWQRFAEILREFPKDIFSDLPKDLAKNHDCYLYDVKKEKEK